VATRGVFFDAGETLVHPEPSFPELFAAVVTREGYERAPVDISEGLTMVSDEFVRAAVEEELWTTSPERSRRFWVGVYDRFLEVLDIPRMDGLSHTLYREFSDVQNYGTFDDVVPTLEALRAAGYLLGVVSNFEPWLESLLDRLELTALLPIRVVSGLEGVEKPDPAIFRLALERSALRPDEVAYVGDIPDFDIEPSEALGMRGVLIDRRGRHPGHAGDRITALTELPALLEAA
jgi:putative hydrolase of the HAD superfamily